MVKNLINIIFLLFCLLQTSGCTMRQLDVVPDDSQVSINFDWSNLYPGESVPTGMYLYFYGSDGSVISKECTGSTFSGYLPKGNYRVLAYNTDAVGVGYRNINSYKDAQVYLLSQTKATFLSQPVHVYGIGLDSLTVTSNEPLNTRLKPANLVRRVDVQVTVTGNKSAVGSCVSTLNGINEAVNIATGKAVDISGLVSFVLSPTSQGYSSEVSLFGKTQNAPSELGVTLNFTGGGSQSLSMDVTNALDGVITTVVPVNVKIDVEVTGTIQGGFHATLKGWSVESKEIIVH